MYPAFSIVGAAGPARLVLLVALAAGTVAISYVIQQMSKPPRNAPSEFIKNGGRGGLPQDQRVVVCLGASLVQGRVCPSFVDLLSARYQNKGYTFVNAGVNGDTSYHVYRRVGEVIACDPDYVVILAGTNDVICTLNPEQWRMYKGEKSLPQPPSIGWYRENMQGIAAALKQSTHARIALCSLPVLGEDLSSVANRRVSDFNSILRQLAEQEQATYLPVHECEVAYLNEQRQNYPYGRPYTDARESLRLGFMGGIQHYLLRQSYDAIAQRRGMLLKSDLIHGNNREAAIIVDQIVAFLGLEP